MYNSEALVEEVLGTLLAQDFDEFAVVAIDDCSADGTLEVAARFAVRDSRLTVEANPARMGMIRTWNRVLERSRELHPSFEFFAFASDNDPRERTWLSALVDALERDSSAVIAYSRFGVIKDGVRIPYPHKWLFDSRNLVDPVARLLAAEDMPTGAIMYGLHRRDVLELAGDVPSVLFSDVLFLSHLALFGPFLQHDDVLWYRGERRTGGTVRRQRAALFGPKPPPTSYLPISVQHTGWLVRWMIIGNRRPPTIDRLQAGRIAAKYLARWLTRFYLDPWTLRLRSWLQAKRKDLRRRWKRFRKPLRRYKQAARARARGVVLTLAGSSARRRQRKPRDRA
jgi:glycosyltransferase involved in cell wall biosynthesis